MDKKDVIEFFDRLAPSWDADMIKDDDIIGEILKNAEISAGDEVLDVACGTGVMFDYYLKQGVKRVVGIDISPEMAKIAAEKFRDNPAVEVVCGDVTECDLGRRFDRIVVYNAFPHFPDPEGLIKGLSALLKKGGTLTVAHGASRETIDGHHKGAASKVSVGLMSADDLVDIFSRHLTVTAKISDDRMYQVAAKLQGAETPT